MLASLFQYGAFDANDTYMASRSLMAYMIGLPAFILIKVLAPGYYARQDTKTPVKIGIIAMVANMVLNLCFVLALIEIEFEAVHVGLALATTLSAYINAILLYRGLRADDTFVPEAGWMKLGLQIVVATAFMVMMVHLMMPPADWWNLQPALERVLQLMVLILFGLAAYIGALMATGVKADTFRQS